MKLSNSGDGPFVFRECLSGCLAHVGLSLSDGILRDLEFYFRFLMEARERYNLTGKLDEAGVCRFLFFDSLLGILSLGLPGRYRLLDIGTGAGFPGLVLKIACPDLELTLLDSCRKKIDFVRFVCENLKLDNVSIVQARAEEAGRDVSYREQFDIVTSKAFSELDKLVEISAPFLKKGGKLAAWKGIHYSEEIEKMQGCYVLPGLGFPRTDEYLLRELGIHTVILVFDKVAPTPDRFPRSGPAIRKRPLSGLSRGSGSLTM